MLQKYPTVHEVLCSHKLTVQVQQAKDTSLDQTQQLDDKQVDVDVQLDVQDKGNDDWVANTQRFADPLVYGFSLSG